MVEVNSTSVLVTLGLVVVATLAGMLLNEFWFRPKKLENFMRNQGFQGNPYSIFHGDKKDIATAIQQAHSKPIKLHDFMLPYLLPFDHQMVQKYGNKYFIWHGRNLHVNITDPDMLKDIMNKYLNFRRLKLGPLEELLIVGIIRKDGDAWVKRRKIINRAFTIDKLQNTIPVMSVCYRELVEKWEKMIDDKGSGEVDVWPDFSYITADVISRTAFGSNYETGRHFFVMLREQMVLTFECMQRVYIKGSWFLPTKRNRKLKEIYRETDAIIRDVVKTRLEKMKANECKSDDQDLLGILLESSQKEIEENDNKKSFGLSIEDVVEECRLFYLAGQETSSNLLVWTMIMLAIHKDWQQKAREEVFQLFGNNSPKPEELPHLKILTMIFYEVLRMLPPITNLVRFTHETTKLAGDVTIPSGASVVMNLPLVHYDPQLWGDDAKEFKPERFAGGVAAAAKKPNSYFPFGMGPRICLGFNFSLIQAKIGFAMILQKFSFELSPAYEHAPFPRLTIQPRFGAQIILHKLK